MSRNHLSVVLSFLVVVAFGVAGASNIDQSPRRFAAFGDQYVLSRPALGSSEPIDLPSSPDDWLGGTGNWSDAADWSSGLPGSNSDVSINTGNDNVTLDNNFSINSLTLGGSAGTSNLTANGNAYTLAIAGALTVNPSGNLYLADDTMTTGASSTNQGTLSLEFGSSLQINGDFSNSGTLYTGQGYTSFSNSLNVSGTLTNTGTLDIGHVNFNSAGNGTATVGALNNSGTINMGGYPPGSVLQVNGDATNSGGIYLDINSTFSVSGNMNNSGNLVIIPDDNGIGGKVMIDGTLTNTNGGSFVVGGELTTAQVGNLINQGSVTVTASYGSDATLHTGDLTNSGSISFGSSGGTNHLSANTLTNTATGVLYLADDNGTASAGTLVNAGSITLGGGYSNDFNFDVSGTATNSGTITTYQFVQIEAANLTNSGSTELNFGSMLRVSGNVNNSGTIVTANSQVGGVYYGNTINITGKLSNNLGATFSLGSIDDTANIGYVTNAGTVSLAGGTIMNVTGGSHSAISSLPGFLNTGMVDISAGASLSSVLTYTQTSGQTTVDGVLRVSPRAAINLAGGSLYGNDATLQGQIVSSAAINIGDSPLSVGQLSFVGNYTQLANGSLTFDIAGPSPGQYDQLNVSGHAQLNGLMTVDLLHSYVPQIGNTFDIMNFASAAGTFSTVIGLPINGQEHFVLEYNPTNLTLDVEPGQMSGPSAIHASFSSNDPFIPISQQAGDYALNSSNNVAPSPAPEPGTLLLFATGVAGLAGVRCAGRQTNRRR